MKSKSRTDLDRWMLCMIGVPIGCLILLIAGSAVCWQVNEARIRPLLDEHLGIESVAHPTPFASEYDAETSKDQTVAFRELLAATTALNQKYDVLLSNLRDDEKRAKLEPSVWWKYVDQYATEAQPLLRTLDQIDFASPIWLPFELGIANGYPQDVFNQALLTQMLHVVVLSAAHANDTDRVIETLEQYRRLFGKSKPPGLLLAELVRVNCMTHMLEAAKESLSLTEWSDEQLQQLEFLLDQSIDLKDGALRVNRTRELTNIPILLGQAPKAAYTPLENLFVYAPSVRLAIVEQHEQIRQALQSKGKPVGKTLRKTRREIANDVHRPSVDTLLQFPTTDLVTYHEAAELSSLADGFDKYYFNRNFVRAAVAVKRYELKFGAYPERLDQLEKVGIALDDLKDASGRLFFYGSYDDHAMLGVYKAESEFAPADPAYLLVVDQLRIEHANAK